MAPLPPARIDPQDLSISSLELDRRAISASYNVVSIDPNDASSTTIQPSHRLLSRAAASTYTPCAGCTAPESINNHAFFALFAILGVAMIVVSIWFFFHAKNGGFVWQNGDWDDYKSTVLRRKGPDGKTLSNATKSTKLGGGSIVAHQARWAAKSVVGYDEKGRKGILGKRGFGNSHSVTYRDTFSDVSGSRADDMSEAMSQIGRDPRIRGGGGRTKGPASAAGGHHANRYRDRDVRDYRHEKAATVGGMNRQADGSHFGYSDRSETMTEISDRSTAPILTKKEKEDKKRTKAERRAHEEAARMERKWRKEAELAAAALAHEHEQASASKPKSKAKAPAASPSKPPTSAKRERRGSRSNSPQKRDYSFSRGDDDGASTVPSSTTRSASYYEAYRPRAERSERAAERGASRSRHSSPTKKNQYRRCAESDAGSSDTGTKIYEHKIRGGPAKGRGGGGRDVMAGYRRGMDSLADSDED
ncbi:hypothetical protein MBLNU459_g0785t1 [Dothideomycetes sp. NU459]